MASTAHLDRARRVPIGGTVVGVMLLIASGAGYRALASRYAGVSRATPIPKGTLARFPLQFGEWVGTDVPLDAAIIKGTDTDDHLNRNYLRRNGAAAISVFIGYGVNIRDLMPHRPEVCYGGAGWTLADTRKIELNLTDGTPLPCQIHRFRHGALDARQVVVANYYIISGEYCGDVSLLRSKAGDLRADGSYAAQVQVAAGAGAFADGAEEAVRAFVSESGASIRRLLEDAVSKAMIAAPADAPRGD